MNEMPNHPLVAGGTDNAVFAPLMKQGINEPTYSGVLSFMRRKITRDLAGVDVAILGIPFDAATSNRPGTRFGPQGVRRASALLGGDPQYPFRADPFERGEESFFYDAWFLQQNFLLYLSQPLVRQWLESFKEFPPRAKAASFTIDQVVEALMPKA